jgi:RNA ligase (TIGR02306 family)
LFEESVQEQQQKTKSDGWSKAQDRHKKFFRNPIVKYLMRYSAVRWVLKKLFVKKKDKIKWPEWLPRTGSERVQNIPVLFKSPDVKWVASEKVDGMSSSYVLDEKGTYIVCSHNVVVFSSKVKGSENIANGNAYIKQNVWLLMSDKYDMRHKLEILKSKFNAKTVAIQGEIYGDRVQKRTYGLRNKQDLAVFHIWINGTRLNMKETQSLCAELGLQMVHVFDWELHVPSTVEELIRKIDSEHSAIDDGMIEGYVLYSQDGLINYKCVSPSYLLKYH